MNKDESSDLIISGSLMSPVAAAGPTRTAVEPAAVSEPCPSTDYGTSGEYDRQSFSQPVSQS